jgi:hypothetical protein
MRAAVVPALSSSWQIKDVPQPQPGPGQVLVKMRASGICYTDVHQTLGHLPGSFSPRPGGFPKTAVLRPCAWPWRAPNRDARSRPRKCLSAQVWSLATC